LYNEINISLTDTSLDSYLVILYYFQKWSKHYSI